MLSGPVRPRIAIVGAGIAGLTVAGVLAPRAQITVFEKSRGVGGRMATRRAGPWQFDHGTQFFTARSSDFRTFLDPHIASGAVADWNGRLVYLGCGEAPRKRLWFEPHYVACPSMSALCKVVSGGIAVHTGVEVAPLTERTAGAWNLQDAAGAPLGNFDAVICTAPAPQTVRLLDFHLAPDAALRRVRYRACFALMLGLEGAAAPGWIAGKARDNPIEWIAVQSTRPGRNPAVAMVAHASADWSDRHLESDAGELQRILQHAFGELTGIDASRVTHAALHRWRYALLDPETATGAPFLSWSHGLAATGDWCSASRVEDAWHAGRRLAADILAALDGKQALPAHGATGDVTRET
jgi:hypothetical protein